MADYSDLESIDPLTAGYRFYSLDSNTGQVIFKRGGSPLSTTPAAQRQGTTVAPENLMARIQSGEFDPLKDLYLDPVRGPLPFTVEKPTGISPDFPEYQDYLIYTPREVSPEEGERSRQIRIAGQSQGRRSTRIASRLQPPTALSPLGETLGAGSPQLGARTMLAPLAGRGANTLLSGLG